MSSIFISIASYRDPELIPTIKDLLDKAHKPDRLHIGIVYQGTSKERPDFSFIPNYSLISIHPRDALGVGFARSEAMKLYRGETYFFQIDSHMRFVQDWDKKIIEEYSLAQKLGNKKVILSCYPQPYSIDGNKTFIHKKTVGDWLVYPTKQKLALRKDNEWGSVRVEFDNPESKTPELSTTVQGAFIFADGSIVTEVPYDPEISFFGEEVCFAVRSWTRGWDIYSPKSILAYHFYHRGGYRRVWQDNSARKRSWADIQRQSREKQKRVLCNIEEGVFGLGTNRKIEAYESMVEFAFKDFYAIR